MRHRIVTFIFLILIGFATAFGQTETDKLAETARQALEQKEYIKARYNYLQAYQGYAKEKQWKKAVECGVKTCELYHREYLYNEAFDLLLQIERTVLSALGHDIQASNVLRYPLVKERMQMYVQMKRSAKALELLDRLDEVVAASRCDSLESDLLYTQAICYYTFGMTPQGDKALNTLIRQYSGQDNFDRVKTCYMTLINMGRKANSARMVARAYDSYIQWNDSINALNAQLTYQDLDKKYQSAISEIETKDSTLTNKQYIIASLGSVLAILSIVLLAGGLLLLRFIRLSAKQKKEIAEAEERNRLKTGLIRNLTIQLNPTIEQLDKQLPPVKALTSFIGHIQELAELEDTLDEPYELKDQNIATFCEKQMDNIRPFVKPDVTLTVNAPKINVAIHAEQLGRLINHLLVNAIHHTPSGGKITLDFKKRSAHTMQFIVSDTGCGIAEEKREQLFKPFTEIKDLMQGDGLGLPICALIAQKMKGTLTLDTSYTKGTRFIVNLNA